LYSGAVYLVAKFVCLILHLVLHLRRNEVYIIDNY